MSDESFRVGGIVSMPIAEDCDPSKAFERKAWLNPETMLIHHENKPGFVFAGTFEAHQRFALVRIPSDNIPEETIEYKEKYPPSTPGSNIGRWNPHTDF